MFNADIKFIILSIDIQDSKLVHYVLSSDKNQFQYPSSSITNEISISEAKKICFEKKIKKFPQFRTRFEIVFLKLYFCLKIVIFFLNRNVI